MGLYTHLLTALVAVAHGIYVVSQQGFRFNKSIANYLFATTVGLFIFLPWIFVFIAHITTAKQLTSHVSLYKLDNPLELIAIWLAQTSRIFFDFNLSTYIPLVNKSFFEIEHINYHIITGFLFTLLIFYILYFFFNKKLPKFTLFLILLGGVPSICLVLPDLILGGIRSTVFRYQLPLYLSLQIAVAYVLGVHIFSEKHWQQKIWQGLMVGFLLAGMVSDVMLFKADTWWLQIGNQYSITTAKYINQLDNTLLLSTNHMYNIGSLLIFNHLFNSNVNLLIVKDDHLPILPQEAHNIFLFDSDMTNTQNLLTRFKEDKTYSLRSIDDPLTELWQLEKTAKKIETARIENVFKFGELSEMCQEHQVGEIREVRSRENVHLYIDYPKLKLDLSCLPVALFIRFALVGLGGVAIDMGVFTLLHKPLGLALTPSTMLSTEIAIINNFFWNDVFTFSDVYEKQQSIRQRLQRFFKFNLICFLGLILNSLIVNLLFYRLGVNEYIAKLVAIACVTLWNFWFNLKLNWQVRQGNIEKLSSNLEDVLQA